MTVVGGGGRGSMAYRATSSSSVMRHRNRESVKAGGARVVIVGGGIAGLFLARKLMSSPEVLGGRRDEKITIDVIDAAEDPRGAEEEARAFGMGIGARAQKWIREIDDDSQRIVNFMKEKGVVLNRKGRGKEGTPIPDGSLWLVPRQVINAAMVEDIERRSHGQKGHMVSINLRYNTSVTNVNLQERLVETEGQNGEKLSLPYKLLIGADGINSVVRQAMHERGVLRWSGLKKRPHVWKTLAIPFQPGLSGKEMIMLKGDVFGALLPRSDGRYICLTFYREGMKNPNGVESVADLHKLVLSAIPEAKRAAIVFDDEMSSRYLERRPSPEHWSKCDTYHSSGDMVVLVGDSCHSCFATFGQGASAAIADSVALYEQLEKNKGNIAQALEGYSARQVKEGHAVSDLNLIGVIFYTPIRTMFILSCLLKKLLFGIAPINETVNDVGTRYVKLLGEWKFWVWTARLIYRLLYKIDFSYST